MDERLVQAWREAGADLGVRVVAPYRLDDGRGEPVNCEVFLPDFGSSAGAIIVSAKTERRIRSALRTAGLWVAVSPDRRPTRHDCRAFANDLKDFGWFGPGEEPDWSV